MKLTRIRVQHLRCINNIEVFLKDYTSLIGPNNAGKSSVLRAVEIFLNQEKPAIDEWQKGHEAEAIEIEGDFEDLQEWERDKPGVSSLIHNNKILLRCLAKHTDNKVEVVYEAKIPKETIDGWDDSWGKLDKDIQTLATENDITGSKWKSQANKERVRQLVRERMPTRIHVTGDPQWTTEGVSINAALQQALPQAQIIPAIRDADEDGKPGAKTSFGLLIKSIILPAVTGSDEYRALMQAVKLLEQRLKGDGTEQLPIVRDLANQITARLSELITAKVTVGMDPPDAEKFIGSNTVLRLDDGTDTRIALQGHGLQRALIFALLEVLAAQKALSEHVEGEPVRSRSTLLLFEEPELFIHPHLIRRLKEILHTIAERKDWQVVVSTHSPFLVDVSTDPCSLVIHRRQNPYMPPTAKQLTTDPFSDTESQADRERLRALLDFHPTVCESFFAKHVVLVEGDTEVAALVHQPDLYRLAGLNDGHYRDVTVVSCDGKWTIVPVARLLKAFDIPLRIIHDCDRKGKSLEELKSLPSHEFHANKRIADVVGAECVFVVDDTFENVLWEGDSSPRSSKDKPYRAWKRVRELCAGKDNLDHVQHLKEIVDFAFKSFSTSGNSVTHNNVERNET